MSTQLIPVPFRGTTLFVTDLDGQPFAPMKPIVEGMGLDWSAQYKKLNENKERWGIAVIAIPTKGADQESICLPLRKLPGWLMTIQPTRVKPEIKDTIIAYQNECDEVLWQYWNNGKTTNPRFDAPQTFAQALRLAAEQQERIEQQQRELVAVQPKVAFHDQVMIGEAVMDFQQMFSLLQRRTGQKFTRMTFLAFARRHGFACQPNPYNGVTLNRFVPRTDYIGPWFVSELHPNGVTEWMVRPMAIAGIVALIEFDRNNGPLQANDDQQEAA
jgi:hypothetical protein